jgi:hypothetical protein
MRKMNLWVVTLALSAVIFTVSCKKEDAAPTPTTTTAESPKVNTPTSAFGVLAAIKVISSQSVMGFATDVTLGTATIAFTNGGQSCLDGGNATCNGKTVEKFENSCYAYKPSQTDVTGIDFGSGDVAWQVAGNSSNSIPSISETNTHGFPNFSGMTDPGSSVSTGSSFTLSATGNITNADSTIFVVASGSVSIRKTVAPGVSSTTFSSAEMSSLPTGTGLIQISAYNIYGKTIGGKELYFVNMTSRNKFVEFN